MMLDTFSMDFFQVAASQGYFLKWKLPKCPIFQAVTSQVCHNCSAQPLSLIQTTAFGPHCSWRRLREPNITIGKLPLGKLPSGKLPLAKLPFGKGIWKIT